jgi:VCBS repeat-containing protein
MSDKKNGAIGKKSTHGPKRRTAIVEALEARTLFSADILGALLDPASNEDSFQDLVSTTADSSSLSQTSVVEQNTDTPTPVTESTVSETSVTEPSVTEPSVTEPSVTEHGLASAAAIESAAEAFSQTLRHELVIIDSSTPNYQQIVDDILAQADAGRHIEFVMLDPARDGLAQLNELFATYSALDAVHLISHGSAGAIALGDDLIDLDVLRKNADQISRWSSSLSANGDFLIYGCDLAASPDGTLFIDTLSQITGADVAASDNLTGSAKLGGDWSLEYVTGAIESHLAVSIDLQNTYDAVLANTAPVLSGANSFTAINEDNISSSGTLVSALIAGKVSDVDGGAQGIAIIAVDNTNGSWQYTTDGSTWNGGTPNQYNALLLAADANNAVRFVPNADYNGTVTNGISYYAWDQSAGVDGTVVSTIRTDTVRDDFTTQAYTNNNGTQNWSSNWVEIGDGSGATGGDFSIQSGQLRLNATSTSDYIYRQTDLSGALTANLSFSYDNNLSNFLFGSKAIQLQVSGNGGGSWTTLYTFSESNNATGNQSYDISSYMAANTQVRFKVSTTDSSSNYLFIDNFQISYEVPGTGGTTAFSTSSASSGITVNPVNDNPVNTVPATKSLNEDTSTALGGISVNDVDGNVSSVQLSISNSSLTVSLAGGATISAGANSSNTLTLSGTQTQINAALGTLSYLSTTNYYGSDTLTLLSADSNGATDSDTMAITVNNVNDPVTITSSATANAAENQNVAYTTTVFNPDPDTLTYSIDNTGTTSLREDNAKVSINASSGVVSFLSTPNFESPTDVNPNNVYHIKIKVNDNNGNTSSQFLTITITNANDTPTGGVFVSGSATENQVLSASNTLADQDGLGAITYQWQRNGVNIGGATASTYTLGDADVGAQVKVVANYTDGAGFATSVSSTSVGPVANVNDAPVGVPTITGTVTENQTLTVNTSGISDADGLGVFSYQWLRNGAVISGATATTYTLGDVDVGTSISVRVTYTDAHGTAEGPLTSAATAAVVNVNDVPLGLPVISGTLKDGQVLTADTSGMSDADGLGVFTYQWKSAGVNVGTDSSTYTLLVSDIGNAITVDITYADGHGTSESLTSVATGVVSSSNTAPTGTVSIDNLAPNEGDVLSASNTLADVDGPVSLTVSYQWYRNGSIITGATGNTYTAVQADVGKTITVVGSYVDGLSVNEAVTSAATAAVININDVPTGLPTIDGAATENQTLTADTSGISDEDGLGAFSYQWLRNGADIPGAAASTYVLGNADVAANISVRVTYTDAYSNSETLTSAQTAVVTNVNDAPVGLPSIDGVVTEDQILTANTSAISDDDGLGAFTYQWFRNGAAISGATASTYVLGDADVDTQISLQVSYTDSHGGSEGPLTSSPTASVVNVNDAPTLIVLSSSVVDENTDTSAGYSVGGLTTTDVDVGDSATYTISGGADSSLFAIGGAGSNELILTNGTLDFETKPSYTVIVRVTDAGGLFHDQSFTVNVVNANEAPLNTVPAAQTVAEDSVLAIGGLSVNDVDGNLATVQLSVTNGTLSVTLSGAASISGGSNGSSTLTLSGSQADINTTLASLSYQGNLNYNGADTLTVVSTDSGGVPLGDSDPIAITVTAVNDVSVFTSATTANAAENQTAVLTVTSSDVDGGAPLYSINGGADSALFSINSSSGVLSFNTAPNFEVPSDSGANNVYDVVVQVSDGNGGITTQAIAVTVTNVNEAPVNTVPAVQTVAEDSALNISGISVNDVDGNVATVQLSVTNGTLSVTLSGAASISSGSNSSSTLTLSGSQADINATLASLSYQGNLNYNGADTLTVVSTDSGGTPLGDSDPIALTVTAVNDAVVGLPVIDGIVTENQTLTANLSGISDVDGLGTFSYQWLRNGALIAGATSNTYTLGDADVNTAISVRVSYTDAYGTAEGPLTSAATVAVMNVNDVPAFGGTSSGVVIKNVLSNGTTLLESSGRLSIVDLDVGESSFQASTVKGVYGQLTITAAGDWIYRADNSQSAIQQLTELQIITDALSVTAFDGTTHTVVITIQGSALVPVVTTAPILVTPDEVKAVVSNSVIVNNNVLAFGVSSGQYDEKELMALPYENHINKVLGAMINNEVLFAPSGEFVLGDGAETATMSGTSMKNQAMKNDLETSKLIQLNKMDISWFKSNESVDTVSMSSIVNSHEFVNELHQLHRDLDDAFNEEQRSENLSVEVTVGASISLTAGIVSWLLRGGSLLASFMSVAPFWKQLDPLPIIGADAIKKRDEKNAIDTPDNEDDEKDKQIEDIFDEDKV